MVAVLPPDVSAWDDGSNNKWLISGRGALIMNPPSAWAVAKRDAPQVASNAGPTASRLAQIEEGDLSAFSLALEQFHCAVADRKTGLKPVASMVRFRSRQQFVCLP